MSQETKQIGVLEIGAGTEPHQESDVTLDIREDLDHIDYPGIDIATDEWPFPDRSVERVVAYHVLEHIPPSDLSHVWQELDRVLIPGGTVHIELPHAGTWEAWTDPTHRGTGGTTPDIDGYFKNGNLEPYWDLNWEVEAVAEVEFPRFLRPSLRVSFTLSNGLRSAEFVKIPFVGAIVHIEIKKLM